METSILGEGKKEFSDTMELQLQANNTIIDCQVKALNTFTKTLSADEVAVFGDYDIFILYRYDSAEGESKYELRIVKKNLCEVISYEEMAKEYKIITETANVTTSISFQPSCKFSIKKKPRHNALWEIEVYGEIKVSFILNKTSSPETNKKQTNSEHSKKPIIKSQTWKFENNGEFSIQELMEMDFESLKKVTRMD